MREKVFIGLGSNSGDCLALLAAASEQIKQLPGIQLIGQSGIYLTEPQDYGAQPWFYNQVICVTADSWDPANLMKALLTTENKLGRVRTLGNVRYGPRPVDIDILLFGNRVSRDPVCLLPHPRAGRRAFVLVPLLEIAPDIRIGGIAAVQLLAQLDWHGEGNRIYQKQQERPAEETLVTYKSESA